MKPTNFTGLWITEPRDEETEMIFKQPFYRRSQVQPTKTDAPGFKGAGYYKYYVESLFKQQGPGAYTALLKGTHYKEKSKRLLLRIQVKDGKVFQSHTKVWFLNVLDYFVESERGAMVYQTVKEGKQYQYELKQIKNKYPEHFL